MPQLCIFRTLWPTLYFVSEWAGVEKNYIVKPHLKANDSLNMEVMAHIFRQSLLKDMHSVAVVCTHQNSEKKLCKEEQLSPESHLGIGTIMISVTVRPHLGVSYTPILGSQNEGP